MVYPHRVAVRPSIRPSVHPSIHPFIRPFVRASVHHHSCVCVVPGVEQENARLKRRGIRGMGLLDTLNRVCSLVREVLLGFRSEAMTDAANGHLLTKWARDKYGVEKEAAESLSIRSESVHASVHSSVHASLSVTRECSHETTLEGPATVTVSGDPDQRTSRGHTVRKEPGHDGRYTCDDDHGRFMKRFGERASIHPSIHPYIHTSIHPYIHTF